jgi:surface polysaccharide O-acyltransferase-like enzyme
MHKHRIDEIEHLRAISFLAIVMQHTLACFMYNPGIGQGAAATSAFLLLFIRYGVPVFIFITGMVLFYNHGEEDLHYGRFIEKRFSQIFLPYFLWTLIYFVWISLISGVPASSMASVLSRIAWMTLKGDSFYHLWFIVMILQFYLLFPLLRSLVIKFKEHPYTFMVVGFLLYVLYLWFYNYLVPVFYPAVQSPILKGLLDYRDRLFLSWFFYFLLGGFAGLYVDKWRAWLQKISKANLLVFGLSFAYIMYLMIKSGHPGAAAGYVINYQITLPLGMTMIVYLVSSLFLFYYLTELLQSKCTRLAGRLKWVGRYSFGGYFIHPFVLFYINALAQTYLAPLGIILQILISFVLCSAISLFVCLVISKIKTPLGNSLVGKISS